MYCSQDIIPHKQKVWIIDSKGMSTPINGNEFKNVFDNTDVTEVLVQRDIRLFE